MYAAQLVIIIPLTKYRSDSPEPLPSVVSILSWYISPRFSNPGSIFKQNKKFPYLLDTHTRWWQAFTDTRCFVGRETRVKFQQHTADTRKFGDGEFRSCRSKMIDNKFNNNITMRYDYGNRDEEFVFAYKNRPFAVLVSASLPTPTSSYIDHHLVMELGLKMTEVQCKKISFGGKKLRILGKISCTVQCVNNGQFFGNFHLRASVIENLTQHFDTHVVAGVQTVALLRGDRAASSSSGAPSPSRESPPPPSRPPRGPPSPRRSPPPASRPASPTRPSSPPGFPPITRSIHHQIKAAQSHRVSSLILMLSRASRTPRRST